VKGPVDGWEERVEPQVIWYGQSAVRIEAGGARIVIDPFRIPAGQPEADVILISHDHPGHLSSDDIVRVFGEHTVVYASRLATKKLDRSLNAQKLVPGDVIHRGALTIQAVAAYNVNTFPRPGVLVHPPESQGLGFVIDIDDLSFYFAGDTDVIPEMDQIGPVDYAFLPVGGDSVMTAEEAAQAATVVQPSIAIPIHYGSPTGSLADARRFGDLVPDQVRVWIMTPPGDS
jgi:L-ascorbate metabolism protein UlaG (beta-lactamase superfamily)